MGALAKATAPKKLAAVDVVAGALGIAERSVAADILAVFRVASRTDYRILQRILEEHGRRPAEAAAKIAEVIDLERSLTANLEPRLRARLYDAMKKTGNAEARALQALFGQGKRGLVLAFDVVNLDAVKWARANVGNLIRKISAQQLEGVRGIISTSIADGRTWRQTARIIRGTVGLTPKQQARVVAFEQKLREKGLGDAEVSSQVATYSRRARAIRARAIAVTEINRASNAGLVETWRTGIEQGVISPKARKKWLVRYPCPVCAPLANVTVDIGGRFPGGYYMPPVHPLCKCSMALVPPEKDPKAKQSASAEEAMARLTPSRFMNRIPPKPEPRTPIPPPPTGDVRETLERSPKTPRPKRGEIVTPTDHKGKRLPIGVVLDRHAVLEDPKTGRLVLVPRGTRLDRAMRVPKGKQRDALATMREQDKAEGAE